MTSEPRRQAIGSLRAVALDAPDIDRLAAFYEQLAGWQRVPDDDDEWITLDTGDGWRMGLQLADDHVPPLTSAPPDCTAPARTGASTPTRPASPSVWSGRSNRPAAGGRRGTEYGILGGTT
jgi:Glyoxalase-like domain